MSNLTNFEIEGLIRKEAPKEIVLKTYIKNHEESLKLASKLYKNKESAL